MTIQYLPGAYDADGCGTRHSIVTGPDEPDPEVALVAELGMGHLIRRLIDIFDSIDERLGALELRADLARLPMLMDGIPDDQAERYFALYTLLRDPAARIRSEMERCGAGPERDPGGHGANPASLCSPAFMNGAGLT